jgi:Mg-chelatase subunit ChlD
MDTSLIYLEQDGSGQAALRIDIPQSDIRISTHFIALIDISESMIDNSKLTHVKHCMSLLLQFLTADDALSIVTFGDASTIVLNHVKTTMSQRPIHEKAIESLEVNGCTNYSAGLGSVRQILDESRESTLKPGLLTFTDGHANRGVNDPIRLTSMVSRIHELYPTLSMAFIAYGTDHNATLLKSMADSVMGSYSIVNSLEGSATAMGDCLGSIISCAAQNVVIECPAGTTVEGPYTISSSGRIILGDLYTGIDTTILLNMTTGPCTLSGVSLPSLDPFKAIVSSRVDTTPNTEITVTRLRYICAELFRQIRDSLQQDEVTDFTARIQQFRELCNDTAIAGHPVTDMLKAEIISMEAAIQNIIRGVVYGLDTELTQHAAFTSLLRGTTTPIQENYPHVPRRRRLNSTASDPDIFDNTILTSPMRSTRQQNLTQQMRSSIGSSTSQQEDSQEPF